MQYKIWNKKENVILPDGKVYTPNEIMEMKTFGFTRVADAVFGMQGQIVYEIQNLDILRSIYNIAETDPEAALAAIEEAKAKQREAELETADEPSAEERIAAALEYQNLLSMQEEIL